MLSLKNLLLCIINKWNTIDSNLSVCVVLKTSPTYSGNFSSSLWSFSPTATLEGYWCCQGIQIRMPSGSYSSSAFRCYANYVQMRRRDDSSTGAVSAFMSDMPMFKSNLVRQECVRATYSLS